MAESDILLLKGVEVDALLSGREADVMEQVARAYRTHARGDTSVPRSVFLRFPRQPSDRVIALPAYLGDGFEIAGVKWIASFPKNRERGMDRASAVLVLNSAADGHPRAILEASVISAKRTAASAALAVERLFEGTSSDRVGLIGCGPINFEIARFLSARLGFRDFLLHDSDPARVDHFRRKGEGLGPGVAMETAAGVEAVLRGCRLISFATTAAEPHVPDLRICPPGALVLHVSLRDLSPEAILASDNVVDDPDHVCRERTSLHLAELRTGNRDFIRCTLGQILLGQAPERPRPAVPTVFSPFGLGILDLAVGQLAVDAAGEEGIGTVVSSFLPPPWTGRMEPRA
jgi:ornithine cyclodeaminase